MMSARTWLAAIERAKIANEKMCFNFIALLNVKWNSNQKCKTTGLRN
jgi:hypothetical protein